MAKKRHSYLPATRAATTALGTQIAAGRRELGWTMTDLAGRLGVSASVVGRIERGATGTAIGTVLEAAVLCRVPLFDVDADRLGEVAELTRARLALLPQRVRASTLQIDNDF